MTDETTVEALCQDVAQLKCLGVEYVDPRVPSGHRMVYCAIVDADPPCLHCRLKAAARALQEKERAT